MGAFSQSIFIDTENDDSSTMLQELSVPASSSQSNEDSIRKELNKDYENQFINKDIVIIHIEKQEDIIRQIKQIKEMAIEIICKIMIIIN